MVGAFWFSFFSGSSVGSDLTCSTIRVYIRTVFVTVPWMHWIAIGILSLAFMASLFCRKRYTVYGIITLGITVFLGLFLLDTTVLIRLGDNLIHGTGFDIVSEYHRLIHGSVVRWIEMLFNVAVFVPLGFFFSEFLSTTKQFSIWHQIGITSLFSFSLSLCIEILQLIFQLGVFEITDLLLNTGGGFIGAGIALLGRCLIYDH